MRIETKNLIFEVNEKGNQAVLSAPGTDMVWNAVDFWQLSLRDKEHFIDDFSVYSHDQEGKAWQDTDGVIHILYEGLIDECQEYQDVTLEVIIWKENELIQFKTRVENRQPCIRVMESRCPCLSFYQLCGKREEDIVYLPDGLGRRLRNPWNQKGSRNGDLNPYAQPNRTFFWITQYPNASMAWMGVETGGKFLYIGRHDEKIRLCTFKIIVPDPAKGRRLQINAAHLPAAKTGETVETPATCIALLDGDWREGAKIYRAFAHATFYKPRPKQDWIKHFNGFIRPNRQSCASTKPNLYFEDLPRMVLEGKKYGIDTILLFTWWDSKFDTDYPYHDISPENAARARAAFQEVRRLGGRIMIECNATYINRQTEYYKQYRDEVAHLDFDGNDDQATHGYPVESVWRNLYPYRRFVHGCCGSERWRDTLIQHGKTMLSLDPDCIFYDCFGAWSCYPCYNEQHEHGNRPDAQWEGRRKVFEAVRDLCGEEKVLANEVINDVCASYSQIMHSLVYNGYNSDFDFPELFRYTFPDAIITNRFINNEGENYDKQLRWDFMIGMRFDTGEIPRFSDERAGGPRYAQIIGEMNSLRMQYAEFMMDGLFTIRDTSPLPYDVYRTEYEAEDGRLLRILYNASDEAKEANGILLQPDEMRFDIFPA